MKLILWFFYSLLLFAFRFLFVVIVIGIICHIVSLFSVCILSLHLMCPIEWRTMIDFFVPKNIGGVDCCYFSQHNVIHQCFRRLAILDWIFINYLTSSFFLQNLLEFTRTKICHSNNPTKIAWSQFQSHLNIPTSYKIHKHHTQWLVLK